VSVQCVAQPASWSRFLLEELMAAEVLTGNSPHFMAPEHSLPLRTRTCGKLSRVGWQLFVETLLNPLTQNDPYRGRTAPLTSKRCILYIYSINIGTEYFKHGVYSPFYSLQNAVCFIILTYFVPVLFTFYIQDVLKLKEK